MIIKSNAIVINSFSYGESSIISRLILDNGEKISIIIKGAKNIKSGKVALFQSMNLINIDYYHKNTRDIQLFKEGSLVNGFLNIKKHFESIKYGLCIIDFINKALPKQYKDKLMFDIVSNSLSRINPKECLRERFMNQWRALFLFSSQNKLFALKVLPILIIRTILSR